MLADELGIDYLGRATSVPDYFVITDPALHDITICLRRDAATTRVHSPLAGSDLAFAVSAGVVTVTVPRIDTNAVIVFEGETPNTPMRR